VGTDQRGTISLCSTCFSAQLRRRLPWRRYLTIVSLSLAMVPVLALGFGVGSVTVETLRSDAPPPTMTLAETIAYGWDLLTTVGDHWGSFAVVTAIAFAVPLSMAPIVSLGEAVSRRVKTAQVPSLDDHARLVLLDSGLGVITTAAALTASLTFALAIDAVIDTEPGGAQQFLYCVILAVILVVEVGKGSAFPSFADESRMMVKAAFALDVRDRRGRAFQLNWVRGLASLAGTLTLLVLVFMIIMSPAGLLALSPSFTFGLLGLATCVVIAAAAYTYLRDGDRPSGAMTVALGGGVGIFWTSITLSVAVDRQYHEAGPWGVLVGCALILPIYLAIALGLMSIGPLWWLAYITARIDDIENAIRRFIRDQRRKSHTTNRPAQDRLNRTEPDPTDVERTLGSEVPPPRVSEPSTHDDPPEP
jgi:hypothetical protein